MNNALWYNNEPGDEEIPETTEIAGIGEFNSAVRETLDSEGYMGYVLGEPVLFNDDVLVQICILDPQKELPQEIKAYIQNLLPFKAGIEKPVSADNFDYRYDPQSDTYDFGISHERILKNYPANIISGIFNRMGTLGGLRS